MISSLHPSSNLTVRKGSTVKLSCNASGFPIPNISWQREVRQNSVYFVASKDYQVNCPPPPSSRFPLKQKNKKIQRQWVMAHRRRSKSGAAPTELSLLRWTFTDYLALGQAQKRTWGIFRYDIWNLCKNDIIFDECTRWGHFPSTLHYSLAVLHNDQDQCG